jgi:hypothetical protein
MKLGFLLTRPYNPVEKRGAYDMFPYRELE